MDQNHIFTLLGIPSEFWQNVTAYGTVFFISIWGGIAAYIGKIKRAEARFNFSELVGEIVISGFIGIVVSLLLTAANAPDAVIWACAGICGHMGSRGILIGEKLITQVIFHYAEKKFNIPLENMLDNEEEETKQEGKTNG